MLKRKRIREKGKIGLSKILEELKPGEKVAIIQDPSFGVTFPRRFHGKTGRIIEKRGKGYVVEVYDGKKQKKLVLKKINLKKLL